MPLHQTLSGATIWLPTLDGVKRRRWPGTSGPPCYPFATGGSGTVGPRNGQDKRSPQCHAQRRPLPRLGQSPTRPGPEGTSFFASTWPTTTQGQLEASPWPSGWLGAAGEIGSTVSVVLGHIQEDNGRCCGCWAGWRYPPPGQGNRGRVGGASRPAQAQWRLFGRSPLTPVLELEALVLAIEGRRRLWLTMTQLAKDAYPDWDIDDLRRRATRAGQMLPP